MRLCFCQLYVLLLRIYAYLDVIYRNLTNILRSFSLWPLDCGRTVWKGYKPMQSRCHYSQSRLKKKLLTGTIVQPFLFLFSASFPLLFSFILFLFSFSSSSLSSTLFPTHLTACANLLPHHPVYVHDTAYSADCFNSVSFATAWSIDLELYSSPAAKQSSQVNSCKYNCTSDQTSYQIISDKSK